jgi:Tfp pilus assembly protein PilX
VKNGKEEKAMKRSNEKGTAMLFAIILVLVLSVMAASMMFLSQSETWASMNYRLMTQARYGAEAGIHATANFLMNNYAPPAPTAGNPPPMPAGYNITVPVPAKCGDIPCVTDNGGNPIFLSTLNGVPSTYPDGAQQAAFKAVTGPPNNTLQAGNTTVNYTASAKLLSMVQVTPFGTVTPVMVQTWNITAHGDIATVRNAQAEVSAILETPIMPAFGYAAFATNNGCAALSFTGNGTTNSYDSGALALNGAGVATPPAVFNNYGGNVGTNGNQTDNGNNVTINGTLSTPDIGIGVCTGGNVTAFTGSSSSQITGGIIQLGAPVSMPTPTVPPAGTTNVNGGGTLAPGNYGDISLSGKNVLTLTPGVYNINSISESGQSTVAIAPDPITGLYGPVIINVTGANQSSPINLSGLGVSNPTLDPSLMQFIYAGTGTINIVGNGASAAVVYAPNATASFKGNAAFYGSVIAAKLTDVGNGAIHYDLRLKKKLFTVGNTTLNSFTWSRF